MDVGARIGFRELSRADTMPAAELLARGMSDNPIVVQAFGPDPEKRQRRLTRYYAQVVPFIQSKGGFLGAFERGALVGVIGTMRPGCCQPGPLDALRFVPSLLANNPPAAALRVKRWLDAWAKHDPREDHWHVGLLTVEPHVQGLGVGTKLMIEHCARMDAAGDVSYLETDKAMNVRFYQKFGYRIAGQAQVLGVTNWFMKRVAGVGPATKGVGSATREADGPTLNSGS
jgi:ribosomal protein S18 acetylase RimI-like enzyme